MSASNESQRRDSSSGGRNRNRSRNRSRNRNRDRDRNRNQEGFQEGNRNRNRDRNRNRRPRAMKRDATVFEKILEFLTFGLWKPDLTVRDGSTSRTSMERRASKDREEENTTTQTAERPRRERSQDGEGNRERDRDRDRGDRAPREKRPPEPAEVTTERLYVGNLDYETTEADLYDLFNGVGKVKDAEVVCHKYTQRSKGYAFVVMSTVDEAKRAVAVLNNKPFMGRELWVSGAKSTGPKDLEDSAPGEEESRPASVSTEEQPEATEEISGREAMA